MNTIIACLRKQCELKLLKGHLNVIYSLRKTELALKLTYLARRYVHLKASAFCLCQKR